MVYEHERPGWYVADQVWDTEKDKTKLAKQIGDIDILAWGTGESYLKDGHFPFWAKKARGGI